MNMYVSLLEIIDTLFLKAKPFLPAPYAIQYHASVTRGPFLN